MIVCVIQDKGRVFGIITPSVIVRGLYLSVSGVMTSLSVQPRNSFW